MKPCVRLIKCSTLVAILGIFYLLVSLEAISEIYTNHFYVHMKKPGIEHAHKVAKRHRFINRGPVCVFFYIFNRPKIIIKYIQ